MRKSTEELIAKLLPAIDRRGADVLRKGIREWFDDPDHPERRDKRGRAQRSADQVDRTLRHLCRAVVWRGAADLDENFRKDCDKLLKSAARGGNGGQFQDIVHGARKLRGQRTREAQKKAASEQHGEPQYFDLGDGWRLRSLTTIKALKQVGRRYENCLAANRYGHHNALKSGQSSFFELGKLDGERTHRGEIVLQVAAATGEIVDAQGRRNDDAVWAHMIERAGDADRLQRLLLNVCGQVGAWGDNTELFSQAGAYAMFLSEFDPAKPMLKWKERRSQYCAWAKRRTLIVCRRRDTGVEWSRFIDDRKRWSACLWNALDGEQLAHVLTRKRSFGDLARKVSRHQKS